MDGYYAYAQYSTSYAKHYFQLCILACTIVLQYQLVRARTTVCILCIRARPSQSNLIYLAYEVSYQSTRALSMHTSQSTRSMYVCMHITLAKYILQLVVVCIICCQYYAYYTHVYTMLAAWYYTCSMNTNQPVLCKRLIRTSYAQHAYVLVLEYSYESIRLVVWILCILA